MAAVGAARSTGIGSWPGTDLTDALQIAFAECPELAYLPELPARGDGSGMIGRAAAVLTGLAVDRQPAGWRLADASDRAHRQAQATLRSDLDQLEEVAQGYAGQVKLAFTGPWTLAASMERPRGDRVLGDAGARRDLGQSLAEGLAGVFGELARRLPEARWMLQLDEPLLPSVLAGRVPTASGLDRHRAVDRAEAGGAIRQLVERLGRLGAGPLVAVHCCAAELPADLLRQAGVGGIFVDLDRLTTAGWDAVGAGLEDGLTVGLGALPTERRLDAGQVADRVLRELRGLGLGPEVAGQLIVTPACGLAGQDAASAARSLRTVREAAGIVTEELAR